MGDVFDELTDPIAKLIGEQSIFFVATAPSGDGGHVNVSPKGYDSFRVLSPTRVAYLDLTGSGVETLAHLRDNGRITMMFCTFQGPPKIVRIYGRGTAQLPSTEEFAQLSKHFDLEITERSAVRSIIAVDVTRVATSCGYSVPLMKLEGERDVYRKYAEKKDDAGWDEYRAKKNAMSIDGLPGLDVAEPGGATEGG